MFKFLDLKERLLLEQQKNAALQARNTDLEDALLELAEIVARNEAVIEEVQNG
jgi:hypothetical protein